jgi:hypothetical protein
VPAFIGAEFVCIIVSIVASARAVSICQISPDNHK